MRWRLGRHGLSTTVAVNDDGPDLDVSASVAHALIDSLLPFIHRRILCSQPQCSRKS
ncbi:hypothetical protein CO2235_180054 [Cupriavidus oxalaticus]|uniref:Uncharacterized protein n=1 Tax=Cupriavidus oxalaticus TaxID=96344 RepID=A0A375G548_9BURK|nr:hypothetical protein CO2235_180054 [Cupriavidus oxalaticus]